jgi:aryl-alcohol dehydrogenase-like predicted oxidoreductase
MQTIVQILRTDLWVSPICYGTNMMGGSIDSAKSWNLLDHFVGLGGNFIDSARSYGRYRSEATIGAWLKSRKPTNVVIATKGVWKTEDGASRFSAAELNNDLEISLRDLGRETIDLYWLHTDDDTRRFEPIVDALITNKRAGRIRWFGASNWSPERIRAANAYAKLQGSEGFVAIQPMWGLAVPNRPEATRRGYGRHYEEGLESVHASGLSMIPYTSQSFGFFAQMAKVGESGLDEFLRSMFLNDTNRARLAAAQTIAAKHGASASTIALAYLISQPHCTVPIIGTSRLEQLDESVKAAQFRLTPQELAQLQVL